MNILVRKEISTRFEIQTVGVPIQILIKSPSFELHAQESWYMCGNGKQFASHVDNMARRCNVGKIYILIKDRVVCKCVPVKRVAMQYIYIMHALSN